MEVVTVALNLNELAIESLLNEIVINVQLNNFQSKSCFGSLQLAASKHKTFLPSGISVKRNLEHNRNIGSELSKQPKVANRVSAPSRAQSSPRSTGTALPNSNVQTQGSVIFGRDMDNNFICPVCKKSFSLQTNANRHFANVHNKISYKCEMCDYACRKDYLKVHAMKNHNLSENLAKMMVINCKPVQLWAFV